METGTVKWFNHS